MRIYDLDLYNFRNYHKQKVVFGDGINIFVGDNGSGKTNLLESIYFLSLAKSYKTNDVNLINYNQEFSRIVAKFDSDGRINSTKMIISKNGKKIIFNGSEVSKLSDYIGNLNVLSFLPEDINLIKGSPKDRRYFIDMILGQIDRNYLVELTNYKKLIKQRNEILKGISENVKYDNALLDVINLQAAESAKKVIESRANFVDKINHSLTLVYNKISGNKGIFKFGYQPSISGDVLEAWKSKYKLDLMLKMTNSGPHRDDYMFSIDNLNSKDVSSQGEQRIMIISLILAITEIIRVQKKESPVLLLDDVFSELDTYRQNKLIDYISKFDIQVIITTTHVNEIKEKILNDSKIFIVNGGNIEEDARNE